MAEPGGLRDQLRKRESVARERRPELPDDWLTNPDYRDWRVAALLDWLSEKWGEERPCPYCGNVVWNVDPTPIGIERFARQGLIPAFLVACTNCGQSAYVLAEALGVQPPEKSDE
jgi:hypothetical protein